MVILKRWLIFYKYSELIDGRPAAMGPKPTPALESHGPGLVE